MALAFTALSNATASTSQASSYAGTAGTPASGDLLIAVVQVSDSLPTQLGGAATFAMTGTWTWTLLYTFQYNTTDAIAIFYARATAATSTTPTFTCTGDAATGCIIDCWRVTGQEGAGAPYFRQIKTNTGTSANPSVTMDAAILTGNGVLGFASNKTNSATQWTAPGSWTEAANHEVAYNTPTTSLEIATRASGETGSTITWTNANTSAWIVGVIEFYVSGTGPTEPFPELGISTR